MIGWSGSGGGSLPCLLMWQKQRHLAGHGRQRHLSIINNGVTMAAAMTRGDNVYHLLSLSDSLEYNSILIFVWCVGGGVCVFPAS